MESRYDRGLTRELAKIRREIDESLFPSLGALKYLDSPPLRQPLRLRELLNAYANPLMPTFSQAVAIAQALKEPISIITGPPGTGKTHTIAGLVLESLIQRKSVLIASRINTAVDTAVAMVERLLGKGTILRTGNSEVRAELAALTSEIAGQKIFQGTGTLWQMEVSPPAKSEPEALWTSARRFEQAVQQLNHTAHRVAESEASLLRWYQWLQRWRIARYEHAWQVLLHEAEAMTHAVALLRAQKHRALHERLNTLVARSAGLLARLHRALEQGSRARQTAFEALIRAGYPIALSSLTVSTNLPLKPELFDLLIIDEASTCDPASLLPLLYRAKQVVVIGDPQQLPHVTGSGWRQVAPVPRLWDARGHEFSAEFGASAYDLVNALVGGEPHAMLTDHFRCPPQIISFVNRRFYGGSLRIHTPEMPHALELRMVEGEQRGTRSGSRVNTAHQDVALQFVHSWIERDSNATYGIVTPYRATAEAMLKIARENPMLSRLLDEERLLIGTAHRFQGNEVDYLAFATVAGANATERDLRWVEQPNLFDVAITRARKHLLLIVDATLWERGALPLCRALVETQVVMQSHAPSPRAKQLYKISEFLQAHHYPHHLQVIYRGYPLDILDTTIPPRWAFNLLDAPLLSEMDSVGALQAWAEAHALARHGIQLYWLEPRRWQFQLARWMAEHEFGTLLK